LGVSDDALRREEKTMICPNCHTEVKVDWASCPMCQQPLPAKESGAGLAKLEEKSIGVGKKVVSLRVRSRTSRMDASDESFPAASSEEREPTPLPVEVAPIRHEEWHSLAQPEGAAPTSELTESPLRPPLPEFDRFVREMEATLTPVQAMPDQTEHIPAEPSLGPTLPGEVEQKFREFAGESTVEVEIDDSRLAPYRAATAIESLSSAGAPTDSRPPQTEETPDQVADSLRNESPDSMASARPLLDTIQEVALPRPAMDSMEMAPESSDPADADPLKIEANSMEMAPESSDSADAEPLEVEADEVWAEEGRTWEGGAPAEEHQAFLVQARIDQLKEVITRLVATTFDVVLLFGVFLIAIFICSAAGLGVDKIEHDRSFFSLFETANATFYLLFFSLLIGYEVLAQAVSGQTLGKRIFRLKLTTPDGAPVGLVRPLIRVVLFILFGSALLLLCLIAVGIIFSSNNFFETVSIFLRFDYSFFFVLGALFCANLSSYWIFFDKEFLSWHDRLSGTLVRPG
jgi:uncharacterized RDD family membrane protein YckC